MLGFGLTLMGGCVATTETGQPSELYFPAHSITPQYAIASYVTAPNAATQENMKATAHLGYYSAENIVKRGRTGGESWGFRTSDNPSTHPYFVCTLASRWGYSAGDYHTHVQAVLRGNYSPILYESTDDLTAAFFTIKVQDGECSIDSGFSGAITQNPLKDLLYNSSLDVLVVKFRFIDNRNFSHDFVVSAYRNDGLGVNILTIPMRSAPPSFAAGAVAVFEFSTNELVEL